MRCSQKRLARFLLVLVATATCLRAGIDSENPLAASVLRIRTAQAKGDVTTQSALLSADSRIWYENKEGPGEMRQPEARGGSWGDWDSFFRSESVREDAVVEGRTVRTTIREINDWYRLVDRPPSRYYMTYYFDATGRIEGTLVHQIPGVPRSQGRLSEFEEWARTDRPGLLEKLMPEGRIVPSLDLAKLWKESLLAWRKARGLPGPLQD
jgi:hypothetical protein